MTGPLTGLKILEFMGIGPAPFCVMLLADLGADVLRIDRPGTSVRAQDLSHRGRRRVCLDMKAPDGVQAALKLMKSADVVVEGFRPGVMERLGLGPETALSLNPGLIYGRMTGWGQTGPLSQRAGHDINYIALSGALAAIGSATEPVPPLNLVGDYGGGSLYLALGIVSALFERERSRHGQVIDAAVVDGASSLMTVFHHVGITEIRSKDRNENFLAGQAPFYGAYKCRDDKFIAIGAIEPQFYAILLERLELTADMLGDVMDPRTWTRGRAVIQDQVGRKTAAEWEQIFEGFDACFAPILTLDEIADHPHMKARESIVTVDGVRYPAAAPRLSRTPAMLRTGVDAVDVGIDEALAQWAAAGA